MCFPSANWKREKVPDHKFDFIDVRDFHTKAFGTRLQYILRYILLGKSFLVYLSDLFTATTMIASKNWSNDIFSQCSNDGLNSCVVVPFNVGKWIFVGCIIFGYILLAYEWWKAKKIIQSRDISYAFTNVMANNYYSMRSYDHFCFFTQIENSTKKKDDFAFFVFFTFKGWKRLLLADGPRQTINALTLYSFWLVNSQSLLTAEQYWLKQRLITKFLLISILFTVTIFAGSLLILIVAALCYVPLLCYIQGNLKEYCCHKVDKRISELMKRKTRARINRQMKLAQNEAKGDFSHLKNKKGDLLRAPIPQATLPQLSLDDDDELSTRPSKPTGPASSYAPSEAYGGGAYAEYPPDLHGAAPEYPPSMPGYDQNAWGGYPPAPTPGEYAGGYDATPYPPSDGQFANSRTHLTHAVTPDEYGPGPKGANTGNGHVYYGEDTRRRSDVSGGGLAYEASGVETSPVGGHAHRRSRSGQWGNNDPNVPSNNVPYSQQWPGYGPQSGAQEGYFEQGQGQGYGQGQGHGRQPSRGYDQGGHAL